MEDLYSNSVIKAAIEVHRALGPGLLESVYSHCLALELLQTGISFEREVNLAANYNGLEFEAAYRLDFIIGGCLIVELKAVDPITKVHLTQMLSYLRLSGQNLGLLINFNEAVLKTGIRRVIL